MTTRVQSKTKKAADNGQDEERDAKRLLERVEITCVPLWREEMRRQRRELEAAAGALELEERKRQISKK